MLVKALFLFALVTSGVALETLACAPCEKAVSVLETTLDQNATVYVIAEELSKVCHLLPAKDREKCSASVWKIADQVNSTDEAFFLKYSPFATCAILGACEIECCGTPYTPEQIHLSATGDPSTMVVTWVTLEATPDSTVKFGTTAAGPHGTWDSVATGTQGTYTSGGWRGHVHSVKLTGLRPSTKYYYMVGSADAPSFWNTPNWSLEPSLHFISSPPVGADHVSFAAVGDMGATDMADRTSFYVSNLVQSREVDFVFHTGDIGYADGYQAMWDRMFRKVEVMAAYAPYMTVPGNHEGYFDFHPYEARMKMPSAESKSPSPRYYSFNQGPVHFVGISTEGPDGLIPYGFSEDSPQYQWLDADLAAVDRTVQPWVIVVGHRPLYCSDLHNKDCTSFGGLLRDALEPLFRRHHVDVYLTAHRHNYERSYPVYAGERTGTSYVNPAATVHILNGAGGCKEHLSGMSMPVQPWAAYRLQDYGFGVWHVNRTHIEHAFYRSSTGDVADAVVISKTA